MTPNPKPASAYQPPHPSAGGVEYEPPLPVSDLFGPDDAWMAAPSGGLTRLAAAGAQGEAVCV